MPRYQYACTECAHTFEQAQSFSDDALTDCPACGGRLRKVFSAVGVVFKGSGFYRTDSRDSGPKKQAAATPAAEPSGKDAAARTESTPTAGSSDKSGSTDTSPGSGTTAPASKSTGESAA